MVRDPFSPCHRQFRYECRPRNPRRAYDHDGREIPPAIVGNHLAQGLRTVAASCNDCQHESVVDVTGFPDDYPVPDVALKLRCSSCGSKQIRVRLNAAEFYEVIRQRTGWSA